jgi:arabinogalactan endo-1,4-beta-galactosidase
MVQVGNEVVSGMIWDVGKNYNPGSWSNFAALVNAGIDGVKDIDQNIKIMMHTINERNPNGWLTSLKNAGATRVDVIGLSYYTQWHGQPDSLQRVVNTIASNHNIKIAVAEYSGNHRLINDIIFELPDNKGFGTFVWEPADWSDEGYGETLFDWKSGTNSGRHSNANLELYQQMAIDYAPSSSSATISSSSAATSSSSGTTVPIVLPRTSYSNTLSVMRNAINLQVRDDAVIQIFDLKGNVVRTLKYTAGNYVISLGDLPNGLYIARASSASWRKTVKILSKNMANPENP